MITTLLTSEASAVKDLFETSGFWPWLLMTLALVVLFLRLMSTGRQLLSELGLEKISKREKKEKEDKLNAHDSQIQKLTEGIKDLSEHLVKIDEKIEKIDEKITSIEAKVDDFDKQVKDLKIQQNLLKEAEKESLYDIIYRKSNYYIHKLHGIPQEEREHYLRLADRYIDLGGNHGLTDTIDYCRTRLPRLYPQTDNVKEAKSMSSQQFANEDEFGNRYYEDMSRDMDDVYATLSRSDSND